VRIGLREDEVLRQPLRPGLSAIAAIDIRDTGVSPNVALTEASTKEYETSVFSEDLANANARAEQVIKDNLAQKGEIAEPACPASE
jgi:membrane fusion protein, multidrug efflux system